MRDRLRVSKTKKIFISYQNLKKPFLWLFLFCIMIFNKKKLSTIVFLITISSKFFFINELQTIVIKYIESKLLLNSHFDISIILKEFGIFYIK